MLTTTIDINEAQQKLKELLILVAGGAEIVITKDNSPVARLVSFGARVAGLHPGAIWTSKDFDEPLSDEFWLNNK